MKRRAPVHLQPATRRWWLSVVSDFELEAHHVLILTKACEALDSAETARKVLAASGMTFVDRFLQPRARPEVAIERDARLAFARLVRELDLDVEPPRAGARPPQLRRYD